jgi:DNA (cytosine-5)-methyltransferase 3A
MSCAQIALRELGIKYNRYYASEIDKFAIRQTQLNFPDTIQVGDIEKWREWDIDWAGIDFIFAGTPCVGFSKAGKGLGFDDPQSRLFWVFVEILNHARKFNPEVLFLFENVKMKIGWVLIISEALGIYPVLINSALVSAQNRECYYWSNIVVKQKTIFSEFIPTTNIPQPEYRGILLRDILEDEVDEKYIIRGKTLERIMSENPTINPDKSYCVSQKNNTTGYGNPGTMMVVDFSGKKRKNQNKSSCLTGAGGHGAGNHSDMDLIIQLNKSKESGGIEPYQQNRIYDINGKSPVLMANMSCGSHAILQRGHGFNKEYVKESKSPTLTSSDWQNSNHLLSEGTIRRLTPTECARLQTIPEWYKWECSDTQQYKMLGNGWTIKVITHILNYLPNK